MRADIWLLGTLLFCVVCEVLAVNTDNLSKECQENADCGEPLFLTPYIKDNLMSEARKASKVESFLPQEWQIKSHSGYVTVDEVQESNLFFWLFPSMKDPNTAPLVLWLGNSPGTASSLSVFFTNGPYVVSKSQFQRQPMSLSPAFYHWSEIMHVLHIDSPGAGFSFSKNASLPKTADDVVHDLYSALRQIFQIFPEYQQNEFYIVGESFSAKYAPLLAYLISLKTSSAVKFNLKGIVIGNGWLDPVNILGCSSELYNVGLIDSNTRDDFEESEQTIASLISNETYSEAFELLQNYFPVNSATSLVQNVTGFSYLGNCLRNENDDEMSYVVKVSEFLNQPEIRRKLHAGGGIFTAFNSEAFESLQLDLLSPVGPKLTAVVDKYRVLVYNGQLDLSCSRHLMETILRNMTWDGAERYRKALRRKWYVQGELAGYVKTVGNFSEILVRDVGLQMVEDRPLWTWDLVKKFTQNLPFS